MLPLIFALKTSSHKHAWFSATAEYEHKLRLNKSNVVLYKHVNGKIVRCTAVFATFEDGESLYRWHDKIYLGRVLHFIAKVKY